MEASVDGTEYTVQEIESGEYVVVLPYSDQQFVLDVTSSKSGYLDDSESFEIYVDPLVVDSTAPSISALVLEPDEPTDDDDVVISASIIDSLTGVANATVYYSMDDGTTWIEILMELQTGSSYEATIPATDANTVVLYYITAEDSAGNLVSTSQESYTVLDSDTSTTTTSTTTTTTTTDSTSTTDTSITNTSGTSSTNSESPLTNQMVLAGFMAAVIGAVVIVIVIFSKKS